MPLPQFDDVGHDINLYCAEHSRSGAKIAILLEELQLQYKVHHVEHPKHEPDHPVEHGLGRVPTVTLLTESASQEEGPVHIHESGHIMQYLVERYDRNHHLSYPKGSAQDIEVNNWLFFQNGKLGPAHDEAEHFVQNAPEKLPYPTEHFLSKARTFYLTLEKHLAKKGTAYLVGNKMTVADIAIYPWVVAAGKGKGAIDIEDFSNLTAWESRLEPRPAFQKGMKLA